MTDEPQRLGVAVIGQGFMGRVHSLAWSRVAQLDGAQLVPSLNLLCGRDGDRLEHNAAQWGFAGWTKSWEAAVVSPDVDLIDICTPGDRHAPIALAALQAGKHVICEKPLANSVAEAVQLAAEADRARRRGVIAMTAFNYRRVPAIAQARRRVRDGQLGSIRHVRATYLQDWLVRPEFPLAWRLDAAQAGSGALGDLGAHLVDLAHFLTGERVTRVAAVARTFVGKRPIAAAARGTGGVAESSGVMGTVSVDDAFAAIAELDGGGVATFEASRMAPGRKNSLVIELNGERASLRFDLERLNELEVCDRAIDDSGFTRVLVTGPTDPYVGQWWPPGHVLGWEHTFIHQFQDLVAAIAANRAVEPSFADGLETQRVLDAIARSARNGGWVEVASSDDVS